MTSDSWRLTRHRPRAPSLHYLVGCSLPSEGLQRVEPATARVTLVVPVSGAVYVTAGGYRQQCEHAFVCPPRSSPLRVECSSSSRVVEVGVRHGAIPRLLGSSLSELTNPRIALGEVAPDMARELASRLDETRNDQQVFETLEAVFGSAPGETVLDPRLDQPPD